MCLDLDKIIKEADLVIENNRSIDEVARELMLHLEAEAFSHSFGLERMGG